MTNTGYDYNNQAYEKYIAKQQIIARWVDQTSQEESISPVTAAVENEAQAYDKKHLSTRDNYSSTAYEKTLTNQLHIAPQDPFTSTIPFAEIDKPLDASSGRKNRDNGQTAFDDGHSDAPTYIDIYHRSPSLSAHTSRPPTSLFSTSLSPTSSPPRSDDGHPKGSNIYPFEYSSPHSSRQSLVLSSTVCLPSTSTTHLPPSEQPPLLKRLFQGLTGGDKSHSLRRKRRDNF